VSPSLASSGEIGPILTAPEDSQEGAVHVLVVALSDVFFINILACIRKKYEQSPTNAHSLPAT
jgi:hypothetical protein